MIRCIHRQTVSGGILIDDIDDGLPNKEVHRLGSLGNPKQYERDGYANKPKQGCYVRYSQTAPNGSVVPGYVTLQQTNKVTASMGKGKIFQMSSVPPAGTANPSATFPLITVITGLTPASFYLPVITGGTTTGGPVTVIGPATSTYVSVTPDITTVTFARGSGGSTPAPSTLTAAQIVAAGGTVTATAISIPAGAFTTVPAVGNTVVVTSNEANSNTFSYTT
jgi:hypothetical protein